MVSAPALLCIQSHLVDLDPAKITADLAVMKRTIRFFLFTEKVTKVKIFDPVQPRRH